MMIAVVVGRNWRTNAFTVIGICWDMSQIDVLMAQLKEQYEDMEISYGMFDFHLPPVFAVEEYKCGAGFVTLCMCESMDTAEQSLHEYLHSGKHSDDEESYTITEWPIRYYTPDTYTDTPADIRYHGNHND